MTQFVKSVAVISNATRLLNHPERLSMSSKTITQVMRGIPVTHAQAKESARRLINSHFNNPDSARVQIPASIHDDDLIITDYVIEQTERQEAADKIIRALCLMDEEDRKDYEQGLCILCREWCGDHYDNCPFQIADKYAAKYLTNHVLKQEGN